MLWLRRIISAAPDTVDILTGPRLHLHPRAGYCFVRSALLEQDDTVNIHGFRCVSVYRAFTDAAAVVPVESLLEGLPHSGAEKLARKLLRAADLAPYRRPYPVRRAGRTIAEIDLAYPDLLYGGEIDGPHHQLAEVAAADKARDRRLRRLGWTIDRFPHDMVRNDPEEFVAEVKAGLAGATLRHGGTANQ